MLKRALFWMDSWVVLNWIPERVLLPNSCVCMWKNLLLSSRTFTCLWIPIHFLYIISFYGFILHCCYLLVATDWILILETSYIQQINMFDFLDSFGRSTRRLSYLEVMHYWRQNNSRMHGMIHLLGQLYCRTYVSLCEAQKLC